MSCARSQQLLQLYLDGRLSLGRARALERHLSSCPACRAEWVLLEEMVAGVQHLGRISEPVWLGEAIRQRIASATAPLPRELPAWVHENANQRQSSPFSQLTRRDVLLAFGLATLVILTFILLQPSLRSNLLADTNPVLAQALSTLQMLYLLHGGVVALMGWGAGIALGVWITLLLAGSEIRALWRQRVRERLPQNWW